MLNKLFSNKTEEDLSGKLTKFIHIGSPKCASTSLQKHFFNRNEQCHYLGGGIDGNVFEYFNKEIKRAVEIDLRYANAFAFDEDATKAHFQKEFSFATDAPNISSCGISYEAFSFTYGAEIDVSEKAQRLFKIFGPDTKIIYVIRNQKSLYKSLHAEHIREGYNRNLEAFLNYSYVFRHRNWFYDFDFSRVYDVYAELFGSENILVLPFELLKTDSEQFLNKISSAIGCQPINESLPVDNSKMPLTALEALRLYNCQTRHTLQNDVYKPFHIHRYAELLDQDFKEFLSYGRRDLLLQLELVELSNKVNEIEVNENDYEFSTEMSERFKKFYASGNRELSDKIGINLEDYGYWC